MRSMSLCVKGVQVWNSLCDDLKWLIALLYLNVNARCFIVHRNMVFSCLFHGLAHYRNGIDLLFLCLFPKCKLLF